MGQSQRLRQQEKRRLRCLIAKVGLDGHDRGANVVAKGLRDKGMEVIYSGLHRKPEEIATATIQEDVDILGISILSGAHNTLVPKVTDILSDYDALDETVVIVGGIIPDEDHKYLKNQGVDEIFEPGESIDNIYQRIIEIIEEESSVSEEENDSNYMPHCPSCGKFLKKSSDDQYKCTSEEKVFQESKLK